MTKTYSNLIEKIYSFDNLHAAYLRARRGKRNRRSVMLFEQNLEGELIQLQNELIWDEYRTGRYHRFFVYEPKQREVAALPFRDRVVQHSLVAAIEPIWEIRFIADSYACRPGRGLHRGANRAQQMMRKVLREHGKVFALKADISKYFASIDHAILRRLLRTHIVCAKTLAVCDEIIASSDTSGEGKGLTIGNLTSQLWANVYLHALDVFAKHTLKARHYIRYMDDFVIFHHDKAHLHKLLEQINAFLQDHLKLTTNRKTQIFPVAIRNGRGLDYLGYHLWPTHRRLRKSSIRRISRSFRQKLKYRDAGLIDDNAIDRSIQSWVAHAQHAQTHGLRRTMLEEWETARARRRDSL